MSSDYDCSHVQGAYSLFYGFFYSVLLFFCLLIKSQFIFHVNESNSKKQIEEALNRDLMFVGNNQ